MKLSKDEAVIAPEKLTDYSLRSIWIIREGENMARLITIIPEEKQ
jgi:hypothetical protein